MKLRDILLYCATLSIMAGMVGCASHTLTGNSGEPDWVSSPQLGGESKFGKDAFYGRGKSTLSDIDVALTEAQDEARSQVGAALQTDIDRVSEKLDDVIVKVVTDGVSENKKSDFKEEIAKIRKNSDKNIVRVGLRGSTIVATWLDRKTGTTWALAKINKTQAQRAMIAEYKKMTERAAQTAEIKVDTERVTSSLNIATKSEGNP